MMLLSTSRVSDSVSAMSSLSTMHSDAFPCSQFSKLSALLPSFYGLCRTSACWEYKPCMARESG